MSKTIYKNVLLRGAITDITVENGKIVSLAKTDRDGTDMGGLTAFAGLIDIHNHGALGLDVTYNANAVEAVSDYLAQHGITAWYPTTQTDDIAVIRKATEQSLNVKGATPLGFHAEGPYISKNKTGAMKAEYAKAPDIDEFCTLKNVKLVTVAPELEGVCDFIRECGATVCLGHTVCDYDTAVKAVRAGAKCVTHMMNAMAPFHHREPSLFGAAVTENMYVQVISDGVHLHPAAVMTLYKLFGADRMVLISDNVAPAGITEDGEYNMNGTAMIVKNGVATTPAGNLYGSTTNLFDCVKCAVSFGIPTDDAFKMASKTPARLMGLNKGEIAVGYDADFILLDKNLSLIHTVIGGKIYK